MHCIKPNALLKVFKLQLRNIIFCYNNQRYNNPTHTRSKVEIKKCIYCYKKKYY